MERAVHEQFLKTPENRRLYQQEKLLVEATEFLAEVMERKNMTRAELARAIGKSKAFVTQVLRGNQNMTLRTLADLFGAMRHEVVLQALPYPEDAEEVPDLDLSSPFGYDAFWSHFARQARTAGSRVTSPHPKRRPGRETPQPATPEIHLAA